MSKHFTFHIDPGHGWLFVPHVELNALCLSELDFTKYSHTDRSGMYLEEDCDAGKFLTLFEQRNGYKPQIRERHTNSDSSIRRKPRNHAGQWRPFA